MKTEIRYESELGSKNSKTEITGDLMEVIAGIAVIIRTIIQATKNDEDVSELIEKGVEFALRKEDMDHECKN